MAKDQSKGLEPHEAPKYTVSEFMEKLEYGNYTRWVTFVMGLVSFADNAEIAVTAIIISEIPLQYLGFIIPHSV